MRLIDTTSLQFVEVTNLTQPYAILSHTWGDDEVSFEDFQNLAKRARQAGFEKIRTTCEQALADGYSLAWVDTCCIDKSSSAELSEAINSMYSWYQKAGACYAYLSDADDTGSTFAKSKWFTRGWTLQELLAPSRVEFYSSNWTKLGEKAALTSKLVNITGIDAEVLRFGKSLQSVSVAKRMSWAAHRQTSRPEDIAYCLMGIFDVNMPMLYGEGAKAFIRLQEEILKDSEDQSLFAWTASEDSAKAAPYRGLLAASPVEFSRSQNIVPFPRLSAFQAPVAPTNRGIPLTSIRSSIPATSWPFANVSKPQVLVGLNCQERDGGDRIVGIHVIPRGGDQYLRATPNRLFPCAPSGPTTTIYLEKHATRSEVAPVPNSERQHAFFFDNPPSDVKIRRVQPASAIFLPQELLLLLGDWADTRAVMVLETPWSKECVCILLWAIRVERTEAYKALFDVVLTSETRMDAAISAVGKPENLFEDRVVSFGRGLPCLGVSVQPTVVLGFDMFSIKLDIRQSPSNFERKKAFR